MTSVIPQGWELRPLSDLADYYNGRAFKPDDWSKAGLPIIRIAQINNSNASLDYYNGNDVLEKNLIRNGDLLFSWSATLTALIWMRGNAVLNQHIFKVEEKRNIYRGFLHQLILNSIDRLADYSHGSTMKHIKKGVLDEFLVPVPVFAEQQKIASILTAVDDVIESTQAQINKLKDLKTGMMQELLTNGIGHTEFKDSPVGRIPKAWEYYRLGNVVEFSQGVQVDLELQSKEAFQGSLPFLRIENFTQRSKDVRYIDKELGRGKKVEKEDVVVVRYGATAGYVGRGMEGILANNLFQVKPNENLLSKDFLYTILIRAYKTFQLMMAGGAMPALNFTMVGDLDVVIPPMNEQLKITNAILSVVQLETSFCEKLEILNNTKKALMQDLLTGKVRVKVR